MSRGAIVGIGVGPGDCGLLTVRAVETLRRAGAVLAPAPRHGAESLALSIVRPHLFEGCVVRSMHFPMTDDPTALSAAWDEAASTLLRLAATAAPAVFVTLGDALLYSTWGYVLAALRRAEPGLEVETIPGVTAMSACAAAAGRPLAEGRDPLLVWSDEPPEDAAELFRLTPNVVFMKAAGHLDELAKMVDAAGAEAVAVRRASQPDMGVTSDLRDWANERDYLTTVLVHTGGTSAGGQKSATSGAEGHR